MSLELFLLDTNTVIYFFKGLGNVAEKILQRPPRSIALSYVVIYELRLGIAKSTAPEKRRAQLQALMNSVTLLPFADAEAQCSAMIRAELEKCGTPIGAYDTMIAGTAVAHNATLVTRNQGEFRRVSGLRTVDWFD